MWRRMRQNARELMRTMLLLHFYKGPVTDHPVTVRIRRVIAIFKKIFLYSLLLPFGILPRKAKIPADRAT